MPDLEVEHCSGMMVDKFRWYGARIGGSALFRDDGG